MKSIIEQLRTLNDTDVKLQTIAKDLARLPKELAEKEEEPRLLREQLERGKAEVAVLRNEADGLEEELKIGEQAFKRYNKQINLVKTAKEFDAIKRSLDTQRRSNTHTESKALELLAQIEQKQKEMEQVAERLKALEQDLAAETLRVEKDLGELREEQRKLDAERARLATDIPEKELQTYNRIVVNRGQAIAKVDGGVCSACFMQLPPQVHNLTLLARDLVTCPSCGRILTAE